MKKLIHVVGLAMLLSTIGAADARAGSKDLLGSWRLESVETKGKKKPVPASFKIILTFKSGGKVSMSISFRGKSRTKHGTYRVQGSKLTLTLGSSTDSVTWARKGKILTMVDAKKGEVARLRRQ